MSEWGLPKAILRFYLELWFVSPGSRSSRSRLPRKVSAERVDPVEVNSILADACAVEDHPGQVRTGEEQDRPGRNRANVSTGDAFLEPTP
jgi:hypothetical protein